MQKYLWFIILTIIFSVIHNYLNLQLPLILKTVVNDIIIQKAWDKLPDIILYLLFIFFLSGIFGMGRAFVVQYIGSNVVFEIRDDMYRALQAHSFRFYDQNRTGDLMSKATSDVQTTRQFLAQDLGNFIRDLFTLAIILVMVFSINVLLSFIFLFLVPIIFFLVIWYKRKMYPSFLDMSNKNGILTSVIQENVTGVRVVKSFAQEPQQMAKFDEINQSYLQSTLKVSRLSTNFGPLQELITMCGSISLLLLGGYLVLKGQLDVGSAISFFAFFAFLYDPIKNMALVYSKYSHVEASLFRINSILAYQDEIKEDANPVILDNINGEFEFRNVWFCYDPTKCDDDFIIKNFSLKVKPGEKIAILGATGSGKSTLINLIPRFYDPSRGEILIDGVDVRKLKLDEYRRQIGIVSQDIFLFSRSIADNIAFGNKKVSQTQIEEVAKVAAIHNFIISLPEGYKTMVGERGQTLSGGQKQRVAIARALLLNPRILILDDSLSSVDIDTEVQIQHAFEQLYKDRTTFIITQRISTIQNCDRILVLDKGSIVELGDHKTLYMLGGIYTKIYDTMFRAQKDAPEKVSKPEITPGAVDITIPLPPLPADDVVTVTKFYTSEFPDEDARKKAELKAQKRIEKELKSKEEKK